MPRMIYNHNLEMEPPTILLKRKDFTTLGALPATAIRYRDTFNSCREMTFQVHRHTEEALNRLWEEVNDYHIIYLPEYGEYFDMHVTLNEQAGTYKTVTCRSLAEAELMQVKLYDLEVNLETDRMREDYDPDYPALLCRDLSGYEKGSKEYNTWKNRSLLHRVLDKAPNYEIGEVDTSLKDLKSWYEFHLSDTDIYSALTGEIAEAYQCLFRFEITRDGRRLVHVHDLCNTCRCGYRGDFHDVCPKCGGREFSGAYGRDTTILVSKDNLAASASIESNKDRLKNCFRVSGGDDIMTAAVAACNPDGSNYFWDFSREMLETMPGGLRDKLEQYNREYQAYRSGEPFAFDARHVRDYNEAVRYVNEKSGGSGEKSGRAPFRILPEAAPQATGYDSLTALLYDAEDLKLYLQHGMMPAPSLAGQTIEEAACALTEAALSPVSVSNPAGAKDSAVSNAVIGRAKACVNTALYRIGAEAEEGAGFYTPPSADGTAGTWRGYLTLTSIADKTETKKTGLLTIRVNGDYASYLKQQLERKMAGADHAIKDIIHIKMPEGDYDEQADQEFHEVVTHYSIKCLEQAGEAYRDCIAVITASEQEALKEGMLKAYSGRLQKLDSQIEKLENMCKAVDAILCDINDIQKQAGERFDFETYLGGGALWSTFCSYRREDSYKNDNYLSDGLDNAALARRASELIQAAQKELKKASTLQYSVSAYLNNLLAMREFRPIVDDFACGNWIHMMVDEKVYHLRLLSYEIDFDNLSGLSVEFSTVEKIWSGISDIRSILSSASQVAGSYSATVSRVNNSAKAAKYVENWVEKGLDATATKIVNNAENQEIVIDQTGVLCRRYEDLEGDYDPCQARIINNGIYTTKDNWKSVSTGLGKICYTDPETGRETMDYGLIAKTVVGKLFIGEGLKIYGKDNAVVLDENGITLDGGKIRWKASLPQSAVSGLESAFGVLNKYLNQLDGRIQTYAQEKDPKTAEGTRWDDSDNEKHLGDVWVNTGDGVVYVYSEASANVYRWEETQDANLKALAQSKAQVFTSQAAIEANGYLAGDLWILENDFSYPGGSGRGPAEYKKGTILIASQSVKGKNTLDIGHWEEATVKNATDALMQVTDISDDSKVTPAEKQQLKLLWAGIVSEKAGFVASAQIYGVGSDAVYRDYEKAFESLSAYLAPLFNDLDATTDIDKAAFDGRFENYYGKRGQLQDRLDEVRKQYTDQYVGEKITEFKEKVNTILTGNTTDIGEDYVISPKIGGGYLYIKNASDGRSVTIDPQQITTKDKKQDIFRITNDEGTPVMGADANGNAYFAGNLESATGTFSGKLEAATGTFSGELEAAKGTFKGDLSSQKIILNPDSVENRGCIEIITLTERDGVSYKGVSLINDYGSDTDDLCVSLAFRNKGDDNGSTTGLATVKRSGSIYNKLYCNTYCDGKVYFGKSHYLEAFSDSGIRCSGSFNINGLAVNSETKEHSLYVNGSGYMNGDLHCNSPVNGGNMVHVFVQNGQHKGALAVNGDDFGLFDTTYEHWMIHVNANGKVITADTISDQRLKSGIKKSAVDNALQQILAIQHKEFTLDYNKEHKDIGYIAQELKEINPKMVVEPEREDDYYHIDSFYLESIITKAMQEFYQEFERAQSRIYRLEQEKEELKKRVGILEGAQSSAV